MRREHTLLVFGRSKKDSLTQLSDKIRIGDSPTVLPQKNLLGPAWLVPPLLARPAVLLYETRMPAFAEFFFAPTRQRARCFSSFFRFTGRFAPFCLCVLLVFFACTQAAGAAPAPQYPVGMRTFGVWAPESEERFDFSVWYPGAASRTESAREGWVVEAGRRGRVVPGFYPVILLSHDTASGRFANNDLAASLAAGGFIVIAPTHMGDNQNDSADLYTARLLRARPRHLLRALETVLDSPDFALYADESRIGLIGVGFGGITALQLAGAVPDPSPLARYCQENAVSDAFCAPWAAGRLARLPSAMRRMEEQEGEKAFAPPLTLYAPELTAAPALAAASPPEHPKPAREARTDFSLTRLLFGKDDEGEPSANNGETNAPSPSAAAPAAPAGFAPVLDFQGGPAFGGTDSGELFVHIALPHSPHYRVAVADDSAGSLASPDVFSARTSGPLAHRRPPGIRKILGIALVAPAGGMMFSHEALSGVRVPVAVIEAGQDALYPPRAHARPFFARLPLPADSLPLATADHFSLFARCSKDTVANLGEACGRLVGDERNAVAGRRDRFLLSFFHSVLGTPGPPASPSGFVAVHHTQ